MNDTQADKVQQPAEPSQPTGIARRRLLRAGVAAGPVVLALSGRSAMAGTSCGTVKGLSPIAWASMAPNGHCVGTSHTINGHTCGKSPGYWQPNCGGRSKTFQPDYRWPVSPFDCVKTQTSSGYQKKYWNSYTYTDFKGVASDDHGFNNGLKFNSVFGGSEGRSFSRILIDDTGSSIAWHFCAALLNCRAMGSDYAISETELKSLYTTRCLVSGGIQLTDGQIKDFLGQTWS